MIPVDAYIRVSRVGGRGGDSFISPELQRESIERVCTREGLKVMEWFEELDASGGDSTRKLWNEAIERVEQGATKGIVCWNLSRFSRSTIDALNALERIETAGGKVYSEEGQLDKLSRLLRLGIAEEERDRARAGFKNAAANAIARGVYIAAKIPFGYKRDPETRRLVEDEERSEIVVELFERRAKRHSWNQLAAWLSEAHDIQLAKTSLSTIINNPAYLGHARQGEIVNENAHKPLVSKLQWDRAHAAKGRKPVHTGFSKEILLRGIIRCGTCGHVLPVNNSRGAAQPDGTREKLPNYQCRNPHCEAHATGMARDIDEYVVEAIMELLRGAELRTGTGTKEDLSRAEKELEEATYALDTFKSNRKAITTLGVDAWNDLLEEYVMAREVAQASVDEARERTTTTYEDVPALWEEWTTESRREFLYKTISDCRLSPSFRKRIPVSERIEITLSPALLPLKGEIKLPPTWEIFNVEDD